MSRSVVVGTTLHGVTTQKNWTWKIKLNLIFLC